MDENAEIQQNNHIELAVEIVAAYVSNNSVPAAGLADLIASVHGALTGLGVDAGPTESKVDKATTAQIKKSITPDALISFEDGKGYKTLKRHLTLRGLSPEAYRAKHGLPPDYPMTSASYSAQRSELARSLGLGQQRRAYRKVDGEASESNAAVSDTPKASRGRSKAANDAEDAPEKAKGRGRPRKVAEPAEADA